jgi:BirA family biotin operon repressor/biotin-[acetyl-CoA-carboxylase] ligase
MTVKDRVLDALESHRGTFFSGQALAQELQVSRGAVWKAIQQLREGGYPIQAVPNRGYCLEADSAILSAQSIAPYLTVPGLELEVHPSVTSTNDLLRQAAEAGAPEGRVAVAAHQTAGRGRRGHSFYSPPDTGLYLSFLLRPTLSAQDSLLLTTCAAAAVALAIEECAGVETQIKWVNDVFCRGKKVCGILTEAALDLESGGLQYAIVGIGVNLFPPAEGFPPELQDIVGTVFPARPQGLEARSQLAGSILNHFFSFYETLADLPFFQDYRQRSLVLGKPISILERGQSRPALALDLEPDFSLRVQEEDGTIHSLSSGEVSVRPINSPRD